MSTQLCEIDLSGPSKSKRLAYLQSILNEDYAEVVEILLTIENVPPTITECREKERHLEELLKTVRKKEYNESEKVQAIVFRHLLGSLYINFEKFWGPTIRVTIDLINHSKFKNKLLAILLIHLKQTNDIIYNVVDITEICDPEDRPDHVLHRNFLFQLLSRFTSFVEANHVSFMDEFFRFINKEMLVSPFIEKFTRTDLTLECDELMSNDKNLEDDLDTEQTSSDTTKKGSTKGKSKKKRIPEVLLKKRKSRETFITVAKIIQSFQTIKNVHRNEELKQLLYDFICCRDSSVQRASFNCLLLYEQEYIGPYIPKLLKIMNDKKVRSEITSLSSEDENGAVPEEHKAHYIPILFRILFGKMISKLGNKSKGKDKSDLRKTLVMRFVGSCSTEEILYFFSLLFDPIYHCVQIPVNQLESRLGQDLNFKNYVPLNKLHAMLGSLSAFMGSVAHLKAESLPHVFKLILTIVYYVNAPLNDLNIVQNLTSKSIDSLKALRRLCINTVSEFFKIFEYYKFSQDELDLLFKLLIWPSTKGFVDKNHASLTPMLKLIEVFASNHVYHSLLVKRNKNDPDHYLLHHLLELYADTKTKRPVLRFIASLLAKILGHDQDITDDSSNYEQEVEERKSPIKDCDAVTPEFDKNFYKNVDNLSFNQEILIRFIPLIFDRLKQTCQEFIDKKDLEHRIEKHELFVLSKLSAHLKDSSQSLLAVRLLLSSLQQQKNNRLIVETLVASQALMSQVTTNTDPMIITYVADILGYQRHPEQRRELCNLIDVLAKVDPKLNKMALVARYMNATSEEIIDSPDLVKWNEGFRMAFDYLDSLTKDDMNDPSIVRDSIMLLLHQTGFIISSIDRYEFSIRDNCSILYEKLAKKLCLINCDTNRQLLRELIEDTILEKFIKKGFRDTNEVIKNTFIAIARNLAIHCRDQSKILKEFNMFCNDNEDLDFWHNIRHIQIHNRSKALARIVATDAIQQVSPKTLSSYFMPLASGFLFSKTYKTVSSLIDNSIKLIGIICKHLNWITYESTLSYYLGLLMKANATYQKTNIKLLTEILKNFNFDLTACEEATQHKEENIKLERRIKKRRGAPSDEAESVGIAADVPSGKRLNPSTAKMVYLSVTKKIIPKLNACLHEMTSVELEHDKNMSNYSPEKEEIKRIPIAYAIIQLLNLLPGRYVLFREQLPGLLIKLTSFLKSKSDDVRKSARNTLNKVMSFVGPAYIPDMLRALKQNLDKGFQCHVLNYSIHSVLDKIPLRYGDLDHSVYELVNSCMQEIFGKPSEDKEVAQVLAKTSEAKKTKSYDTLMILSTYISAEKLDQLMGSIRELLKTSNDTKKVNKLALCLHKIYTGLSKNDGFPLDKLLKFIQENIEESIPMFKVRQSVDQPEKAKVALREDRFLIQKDTSRYKLQSRINEKGNYHMVVENCLRLLLLTFEKRKIFIQRREAQKQKLNCFIGLLSACLKSSSPKCVMRSLKCIHFIAQTKADLPDFKVKCNSIVKRIFILLNLYNGVGMVRGDNFEMIGMCFKTLKLLLLHCEHVTLSETQIRALLSYIEQDINDSTRQATAFATLHSLLKKGCNSPELKGIMDKVADLLVSSEDDNVRSLSIKNWQVYLLNYNHDGDSLKSHLSKFIRQIDYEHIDGRKAVLKMLTVVVVEFPDILLKNYFELLFHLLSQRIVNEESKEIRHIIGQLLGKLVKRLPDQQKHLLNKFVFTWASNSNNAIRLLGTKLISVFVESCQDLFDIDTGRMKRTLGIIADNLEVVESDPKIVPLDVDENEPEENQLKPKQREDYSNRLVSTIDKMIYHSLRLFQRLLNKGLVQFVDNKHIGNLKRIWNCIATSKLTHWHLPVTKTSSELYLAFIRNTDLLTALNVVEPKSENYLEWNAKRIIRILCDKYIELLDRVDGKSEELFGLLTESMILLGQLVANSSATIEFENLYLNSFGNLTVVQHMLDLDDLPNDGFAQDHLPYSFSDSKKRLNLMWLSVKVVMQARKEAALYRTSSFHRRDFVLRWTAAICQELGSKRLLSYLLLFIMTPTRELTDKNKGKHEDTSPQHKNLLMSEDLLKFIKTLVGVDIFNKVYSKVQLYYTKKRVNRKKNEAVMRVKDQARGVKRKIKERKLKDARKKIRA